ncbi:Lrp/AsnC family transcriptional regulator [Halorubrum sp. DTA98]|uniref:siroheme decarboxylase subunit beta n=1 Tax=Halorubrum sp. DTA98 TaxID=3402163 RepID=UPI003AAE666D
MSGANAANDWRSDVDDVDAVLLDGLQSGFPVRRRPFDSLSDAVGRAVASDTADDGSCVPDDESTSIEPAAIVERVRDLDRRELVRRLGPVLDPSAIGSSTLAALRVPNDALGTVVDVVNGYPEVTHNYRRDHEWNVWFVVTAESRARRNAILDEIADRTGYDPLNLPKRTEYALDLQFPVIGDRTADSSPLEIDPPLETDREGTATSPGRDGSSATSRDVRSAPTSPHSPHDGELSTLDRRLLEAIQDGFPITTTPYADVADDLSVDADEIVDAIESLVAAGFIKRLGLVIDHRAVGFRHNRLVAWDVPSDEIDEAGARASECPHVTKCYHRPARPERGWPFTLFTMVHGRDPDRVDEWITELATDRLPYPYTSLDTVERFKQTGTRYETLLSTGGIEDT